MEVDFLGECNTFSILRIAEKLKTLGAPRDPPIFPCPPKGREEEEEEVPGSETPKEVSVKGEVEGAEGTEPEGREDVLH